MEKKDHTIDEVFMRRAFELALHGKGSVSPNPLVGCVIIHDGRIIGEGWHREYGKAHAEVNAIASVLNQAVLPESTVYVNLEPCSHFGKTPPCADLLIHHKVRRVVISNLDSNVLVAGTGIKKLREAGIEVITGILEKEGRVLNKRFFMFMEKQRPYIILKWAQTADGFIARENHDSKWISDEHSRQLVHKWRTEEDAILVGAKTAQFDNPQLNVRDWTGRDPVRVIIDRFLKLSEKLHVFDGSQKTLCYNVLRHEEKINRSFVRIGEEEFLQELVHDLAKRKVQSLIVEGGAFTLQKFIDAGLWDEARIFESSKNFGKGIPAPAIHGRVVENMKLNMDELTVRTP
jgi:diaminohydroxyphosphoribosylaminopyrimidine deaminase / 5-amino-6-(5-phosphoribosylamino)uracil reductase